MLLSLLMVIRNIIIECRDLTYRVSNLWSSNFIARRKTTVFLGQQLEDWLLVLGRQLSLHIVVDRRIIHHDSSGAVLLRLSQIATRLAPLRVSAFPLVSSELSL